MTNLIYMGNFSSLNVDPTESNYNAENAALLNGVSADHSTLQIVNASITDGGDGVVNDDDYGTSDCIYYNTGSGATADVTDTSLQANLTVTLQDGSTVSIEAVVMQMTNGDLFVSDLYNNTTLDNLQISNIEISSITGANYSGWYSNQSVDNSTIVAQDTDTENGGVVDGTNDAEVIDANYDGDSEGDMIDAGDAILAGEEPQDDIVDALGGNDTISSGAGNDDVYAGSGADSVDGGTGDDLIFGDSNYGGGDTGTSTGSTVSTDVELNGASGSFAAGSETVDYTVTATGGSLSTYTAGYGDIDGSNYWLGNESESPETYTWSFSETVSGLSMRLNATDTNENMDFVINGVDVNLNDLIASGDVVVVSAGNAQVGSNGDLVGGGNVAISTHLQFNMSIDNLAISHTGAQNGTLIEVKVNEVELGSGSTGTTGSAGTDTAEDGNDTIFGGEGNDTIFGEGGADSIDGGADDDLIYGGSGSVNTTENGANNNEITLTITSESGGYNGSVLVEITGEDGSVRVETVTTSYDANVGNTFNVALDDGDTIRVGITDGSGTHYSNVAADTQTTSVGTDSAVLNFEDSTDSDYNDVVITASVDGDVTLLTTAGEIYGGGNNTGSATNAASDDGNDTIFGGTGEDTIFGQGGDDSIDGGDDDDLIYGDNGNSNAGNTAGGGNGDLQNLTFQNTFVNSEGSTVTHTVTSDETLNTLNFEGLNGYWVGNSGDGALDETHTHNFSEQVSGAQIRFNATDDVNYEQLFIHLDGVQINLADAIADGTVTLTSSEYFVNANGGISSSLSTTGSAANGTDAGYTVGTLDIQIPFSSFQITVDDINTGGASSNGTIYEISIYDGEVEAGTGGGTGSGASDGGDDTIFGGEGDDTIFGEGGDDSIDGGTGNDLIYGDSNSQNNLQDFPSDAKVLDWGTLGYGTELPGGASIETGGVTVNVAFQSEDPGSLICTESIGQHVESGEGFDPNSSLMLYGAGGEGGVDNTSTTTFTFDATDSNYSDSVQNVSFRINDVDTGITSDQHVDIVTVRAYDANNNLIDVTLTNTGTVSINNDTATGNDGSDSHADPSDSTASVLVNISGPVSRIEIDYDNGDVTDQKIWLTDVHFSTVSADYEDTSAAGGIGGDDTILGGTGEDTIYGEGGDDSIDGGAGNDVIYGDSGTDNGGSGTTTGGTTVATDVELTGASGSFAAGSETVNYTVTATGGNLDSHDGYGDQDGSNYWLGNTPDDAETYTWSFTETVSEMTMRINATSGNDNLDFIINGVDVSLNDLIASGDVTVVTQGDPIINAAGDLIAGANAAATASTTLQFNMPIDTIAIAHTGTHNGSLIEVNVNEVQLDGGSTGGTGEDLLQNGSFEDGTHAANSVNGLTGWTTTSGSPDSADDGTSSESWNSSLAANDGTGYVTMWASNSGPQEAIEQTLDTPLEGGTSYTLNFSASTGQYINGQWFTPSDIPVTFEILDAATGNVIGTTTVQGTEYEDYSIEFTPPSDVSTIVLRPNTTGAGNNPSITLDSVSLVQTVDDEIVGGEGGNDTIFGGEGEDTIFGEGGSDSIVGGNDGDVIDGGTGGSDVDVLDLRGEGPARIVNETVDADGDSTSGTVEFLDGAGNVTGSLEFAEIESVLLDPLDVNTNPDAVNDVSVTDEDTSITVDLLSNDTDADGDALTVTGATVPASQGTLVDNGDGTVTFTPVENFNGEVTISYSITDGNGGTDTAIHTITVTSVNDAPVAVDDLAETFEDTPVVIDLIGNDTDVDGDPLTIGTVTVPADQGTVVDNGDGTVTFTPAANYTGPASITYTVQDGQGGEDSGEAVVNVEVVGVNDGPQAVDDAVTTDEDTPVTIDVLANDTDTEGDALSITVATVPADQGTVEIVNGELVFTPADNFNGEATISYGITDGNGGADIGEVVVTVTPVNDGPVAVDDVITTDEDEAVVIDLVGNDTDVDGDPLTIGTVTVPADQGTVVDNGDGTVTFTPAANFNGPATITYTVVDGAGGTDTGEAVVSVGAVNDGPVAEDDSSTTDEDTAVTVDLLANDTDLDGDDLTVISATVPADQGTLVDNGDGTVTFTPAENFNGEATISYQISDSNGGTDTAIHTVDVGAVNDGTDAVNDDAGEVVVGNTITINALGNDTDADGDALTITAATVPATQGTVEIVGNQIEFTPNPDFEGEATISYAIEDTSGASDTAEITVFVRDGIVNGTDAGELIDGSYTGDAGNDVVDGGDNVLSTDPEDADDDVIEAGGGDDTVLAGDGDDSVTGDAGDDSIVGGEGDDTLDGGADNDTLEGGEGDDVLDGGEGDDELNGGEGSDTVDGGAGNDVIDTGNGQLSVDKGYPGVTTDDTDPNDDRDSVDGGAGDDTISTGDDADTITGGTGADVIDGGIDDDIISGDDGDDRIIGGEGNDVIEGGDGNDTIHAGNDPELGLDFLNIEDDGTNAFGPDLRPDNGKDTVSGGDGNDLITGADDDDVLSGDAGNDTIDGGIDDDSIDGGTGDDLLIGGQGNDTLIGGAGNDVLGGGSGSDDLSGGDDRDRFVDVTAGDTIDGGEGGDDFDTLDLTGSAGADQEVNVVYDVTNSENGIVEYKDQDGNVVDTLTFTNIESIIPCFTPGTLIATAKGERRVEDLAEGDRVITRDNGIQTIRWAGAREMTGAEFEQAAHLKPVLIQQGALGGGLPERDMMVSPQHRMLVANDKTALYFEEREVLVAAKFLTDLEGIDVVDVSSTTYIHIMFDQHEVLLSDGTWTESFQPGDQTLAGVSEASRDEILELFPELATREGVDAYASARRSLKKHEASLLTK